MLASAHSSRQMHDEDDVEQHFVGVVDDDHIDPGLSVSAGAFEEEDVGIVNSDGDMYGGMNCALFDAIVHYKRTGVYPDLADQRLDRSAHCHWRFRCQRFLLHDDGETLLYYNATSSVNENPRVVVKRGEVKRVIDRIHDIIGHLGMKRTQMAIMKKLYWRSVRADVRTFINNCEFCVQKKLDGKKIIKAPIDITSDDFDINVEIHSMSPEGVIPEERLTFSLNGIDEMAVRAASMARMTTYTFRETAPSLKYRYTRDTPYPTYGSSQFKRQPYIKRARYSPYPTGYLLPFATSSDPKSEQVTSFIEMSNPPMDYEGTDPVRRLGPDPKPGDKMGMSRPRYEPMQQLQPMQPLQQRWRRKRSALPSAGRIRFGVGGAAARLAEGVGEKVDHSADQDLLVQQDDQLQGGLQRPELLSLPPVLLMPSCDVEVVHMQKELLSRQLGIQRLQEKVLRAQYEQLTGRQDEEGEGERYEEDVGVGAEETVGGGEGDEVLNVMDSEGEGDEY